MKERGKIVMLERFNIGIWFDVDSCEDGERSLWVEECGWFLEIGKG